MEGIEVLEVLKCLEAGEVLHSTACVSQWLRLSNSEEIWHFYCESDSITAEDIASCSNSPKAAYQKYTDK